VKPGPGKAKHGSEQQGELDCAGLSRLRLESAADSVWVQSFGGGRKEVGPETALRLGLMATSRRD